jgi:hypothetical protein
LQQLKLALPEQPPPRLTATGKLDQPAGGCSENLSKTPTKKSGLFAKPERIIGPV